MIILRTTRQFYVHSFLIMGNYWIIGEAITPSKIGILAGVLPFDSDGDYERL